MLKKTDGFSLIELLIAIVALIIALLVIFELIISQKKSFKVEHELIKMTQNTRASVDILLREFRMAGYKTLEADFLNSLQDWISSEYLPTSPSSVDLSSASCPIITQGEGTGPDMITLFIADTTQCSLLNQAYSGDTTIALDPNSPGFSGSTKFRVNDLIRIGDHTEFAKVVSVSQGSPHILTIDTDPAQSGTQGLAEDQNPGRVIREINVITYTVFNDENDPSCQNHTEGHPVLKRKYNEAEYLDLAEDIEDFQIIPQTHPTYKLKLTTRTSAKADYREGEPDRYKRSELLVDFRVRNFQDSMCLYPATPTINSVSGLDASQPCEITLSWSEVTRDKTGENLSAECAVSEYIVTYDTTAGEGSYTAYPGDSTTCTIDVSALISDSNNPKYYLSVAAVNGAGVGTYTAEKKIIDSSPPAAITDLTANAGENSIFVSWTASPECDVQEYLLYRSTISGGPYPDLITTIPESGGGQAYHYQERGGFHFIKTAIASSPPYSYQDTNVVPCITYYYIVRAYDNTYESADSNEAGDAINDNGPPEGPTNFSFTIVNDTVNLSWTVSVDDPYSQGDGDSDVIGYSIYALSGENEILLDSSLSAGESSAGINTQGYTDFGIKAVDSCNNSSDLVTQPDSCPNPPTVTISSHKSGDNVQGTVTIQGTASSSNPLSQVKLQIDSGEWTVVNGTTDWSYTWDTFSMSDGTYTLTVMAIDDEGCSGSSSVNLNVQNGKKKKKDHKRPSIGSIVQNPGGDPVEKDKSVEICVRVTDESGIYSVILTTNFSETITMTDPDLNDVFCGTIPAHNGSAVTYTITATDDSPNHNQRTKKDDYFQSGPAPSADLDDNGCIDKIDYAIIVKAIKNKSKDPIYDLNQDGKVNWADAKKLKSLYTRPKGASCDDPPVISNIKLTLVGEEDSPVPGDLDDDGDVDSKDYIIFKKTLGRCKGQKNFNPKADYDEDGCITYRDYRIWYGYYKEYEKNKITIQITAIITDDKGIDKAIFTYSGSGGKGSGVLTNSGGDTYQGTYQRKKNKSCKVIVCATDIASPPNSTISDPVSDKGL